MSLAVRILSVTESQDGRTIVLACSDGKARAITRRDLALNFDCIGLRKKLLDEVQAMFESKPELFIECR